MALIDELHSGPERKAALVGLLEQEAYLIASIDRHKLVADEENKDKRIKNFLNKVCRNQDSRGCCDQIFYLNNRGARRQFFATPRDNFTCNMCPNKLATSKTSFKKNCPVFEYIPVRVIRGAFHLGQISDRTD